MVVGRTLARLSPMERVHQACNVSVPVCCGTYQAIGLGQEAIFTSVKLDFESTFTGLS